VAARLKPACHLLPSSNNAPQLLQHAGGNSGLSSIEQFGQSGMFVQPGVQSHLIGR
jgi:hypothetical protein